MVAKGVPHPAVWDDKDKGGTVNMTLTLEEGEFSDGGDS